MGKKRKIGDRTGELVKGRWHFTPEASDTIAAWLRCQIGSLQDSLDTLKASAAKLKTDAIDGQINYFASVIGWLSGQYHNGTGSVDGMRWMAAWNEVSVRERHEGRSNPLQQKLPGME